MDDLLLLTHIGGRPAAFRACDIRSIIELGEITPVPRAPAHVAGLAALRSRPLTVIDSRAALAIDHAKAAPDERAPVVEADGHSYALLVDRVNDVVSAIGQPISAAATLGPEWTRVAQGMIETTAGPAILIDAALLISGPQRAAA
ncbi:chemotaxis protein CheW [Pelagerythrobacter sp.]|uniref:chemotaxis protein CheW n=1 Tax=Pelagerythrobacter sp. TaxID=2800702 RepID=UPI0035B1864E